MSASFNIKGFINKLNQFNVTLVTGKNKISAKIIADSTNRSGSRLTTYELIYPRFIHAEFMTHRLLSKNSASSRAIPVNKMIDNIKENTAMPTHWGKNQKGMQAKSENTELISHNNELIERDNAWNFARDSAISWANKFDSANYHKQIVNRLIEPFKMMKVICSGTEYDNYFHLRCHSDAQPEIKELADVMYSAKSKSKPLFLENGEYHLPYITSEIFEECVKFIKSENKTKEDPLQLALKVSASCCAQVSYRLNDTSIEKALKIYDQLVTSQPVHASPFEHQARPITSDDIILFQNVFNKKHKTTEITETNATNNINSSTTSTPSTPSTTSTTLITPITHLCNKGYSWSGNFREWIQHRHEIPNNTCWKYQ